MTSVEFTDELRDLRQLERDLTSIRSQRRVAALQRAVQRRDKAPRSQILQALYASNANVRAQAADTIAALKPWITDEQWLQTLQEHTARHYCTMVAIEILATQGAQAPFKPLLRAAISLSGPQRLYAQKVLEPVIKARFSVEAAENVTRDLIQHISQGTSSQRGMSLELLGLMGPKVPESVFLDALQDEYTSVRLIALKQAGKYSAQVPARLIQVAQQDCDASVRQTALARIREFGAQGKRLPIAALVDILRNVSDKHMRVASLRAICTQNEVSPDLLLWAAHDEDQEIAHFAIGELSRRRITQAVPMLTRHILFYEPVDYVEEGALEDDVYGALDQLHAHIPLEYLLNMIEHPVATVRHKAINLLGLLRERTPLSPLLQLLEHKDPGTRRKALWALHGHMDHIPSALIVDKLRDRHKMVRRMARHLLLADTRKISAMLLLPLLDGTEKIARRTAFRLLGQRVPLAHLLAATRDQDWEIRAEAIHILGIMDKDIPLAIFQEALCDRNLWVRQVAIKALSQQGERTPLAHIFAALRISEPYWTGPEDRCARPPSRRYKNWVIELLA